VRGMPSAALGDRMHHSCLSLASWGALRMLRLFGAGVHKLRCQRCYCLVAARVSGNVADHNLPVPTSAGFETKLTGAAAAQVHGACKVAMLHRTHCGGGEYPVVLYAGAPCSQVPAILQRRVHATASHAPLHTPPPFCSGMPKRQLTVCAHGAQRRGQRHVPRGAAALSVRAQGAPRCERFALYGCTDPRHGWSDKQAGVHAVELQ